MLLELDAHAQHHMCRVNIHIDVHSACMVCHANIPCRIQAGERTHISASTTPHESDTCMSPTVLPRAWGGVVLKPLPVVWQLVNDVQTCFVVCAQLQCSYHRLLRTTPCAGKASLPPTTLTSSARATFCIWQASPSAMPWQGCSTTS